MNPLKIFDKLVEKTQSSPKLRDAIHKITQYRFAAPRNQGYNALGGAAILGAPTVAFNTLTSDKLYQDEVSEDRDNMLLNFLLGQKKRKVGIGERIGGALSDGATANGVMTALGAGGGVVGPMAVRKGLGRILTNTVRPVAYEMRHIKELGGPLENGQFTKKNLKNAIRNVSYTLWNDAPHPEFNKIDHITVGPEGLTKTNGAWHGRDILFRDFFGLGHRKSSKYTRDQQLQAAGMHALGGKDELFRDLLAGPDRGTARKFYGLDSNRPQAKDLDENIKRRGRENVMKADAEGRAPGSISGEKSHSIMGNYAIHPNGRDKARVADSWDFAPNNAGELSSANGVITDPNKEKTSLGLIRSILSMFGTPGVVQREVSLM